MKKTRHLVIILMLIGISLACSTITGNNADPNSSGELQNIGASLTPTATDSPQNIISAPEEELQDVQLRLSFDDIFEAGIQSGEWTEEEGLLLFLKYFVGEISADEVPGIAEAEELEGTGIMTRVYEYLNSSEGSEEIRAELERLVRIMVPPQDVLDAISQEWTEASFDQTGSIQMVSSNQTKSLEQAACMDLAGKGYERVSEFLDICYFYKELDYQGHLYRVYYPEWWQGDEGREGMVNLTFDGLVEATILYSTFENLEVKNINIIFPIHQKGNTMGSKYGFNTETQACPIAIFPLASDGKSGEAYKQTIAHEVFHCTQSWSFATPADFSTHRWWREGTAEYFSNLVYPNANLEWRFLDNYNKRSAFEPIFDMKYENFVFFQFMGNTYTDAVLIDILSRLADAGGRAGQEEVLRGVTNIDQNFNRFVVEYMGSGIKDTGEGNIVTTNPPYLSDYQIDISEKSIQKLAVKPFVASRFQVNYEQNLRFLQKSMASDETQFSGVETKFRENISAWSDLPPELRSECKEKVKYLYVPTTIKPQSLTYDFEVSMVEKGECDPCLLGTWEVDNDSFEDYILKIMEQEGSMQDPNIGTITLDITGSNYLEFTEEPKVNTRRDAYTITIGASNYDASIVTVIDSQGSGTYSTDGENLMISGLYDQVNSITASAGGMKISLDQNMPGATYSFFGTSVSGPGFDASEGPQEVSAEYTCGNDTLLINQPEFGELLFNRVDKIIPTPIPTAAPLPNP